MRERVDASIVPRIPQIAVAQHERLYLRHAAPLNFAHRGGTALAPENTLPAFSNAIRLGADILECDVHLTRDGAVVVLHDTTLRRTTNRRGRIRKRTLAEAQALDAAYRFTPDRGQTYPLRGQGISLPTLRAVLTAFPELRVNIDLKPHGRRAVEALWQVIRDCDATDRVLVGSVWQRSLRHLRRISNGAVATGASLIEMTRFCLATRTHTGRWLRPRYDALQVPAKRWGVVPIVTPATVRLAHRLGVAIHVWGVTDPQQMRRLLAIGVDGIMTDRPDRLAAILAETRQDAAA